MKRYLTPLFLSLLVSVANAENGAVDTFRFPVGTRIEAVPTCECRHVMWANLDPQANLYVTEADFYPANAGAGESSKFIYMADHGFLKMFKVPGAGTFDLRQGTKRLFVGRNQEEDGLVLIGGIKRACGHDCVLEIN